MNRWRQQVAREAIVKSQPDHVDTYSHEDDYVPACRLGYQGCTHLADHDWDKVESTLQRDWENLKGKSRLTWEQAKQAARAAWNRIA